MIEARADRLARTESPQRRGGRGGGRRSSSLRYVIFMPIMSIIARCTRGASRMSNVGGRDGWTRYARVDPITSVILTDQPNELALSTCSQSLPENPPSKSLPLVSPLRGQRYTIAGRFDAAHGRGAKVCRGIPARSNEPRCRFTAAHVE